MESKVINTSGDCIKFLLGICLGLLFVEYSKESRAWDATQSK